HDLLRERATHLARLFPAAFVVMGHTHIPMKVPVADGTSTYVNLGSWAEEEGDAAAGSVYRAARTHLVIRPEESGPVAEFLAWSEERPRRYVSCIDDPAPLARTVPARFVTGPVGLRPHGARLAVSHPSRVRRRRPSDDEEGRSGRTKGRPRALPVVRSTTS